MICPQDYTKQCPEEWIEVVKNPGLCMAPASYAGVCSFSINTTDMSGVQKRDFAQKCSVQFPCLGAGEQQSMDHDAKEPMPNGPVRGNGDIVTVALSRGKRTGAGVINSTIQGPIRSNGEVHLL